MEAILEEIKLFAEKAHEGQMRKYTPEKYIVHPIRVMELCRKYTSNIAILATALLHDVLEDTSVTKEEIELFLTGRIGESQARQVVMLVEDLTDVYIKDSYPQWNRKKRKEKETERLSTINEDAQTVKYADIIDNCVEIVNHDRQFAGKFLYECRNVLKHIPKGHPELYFQAIDMVDKGIKQLKTPKAPATNKRQVS